MDKYEKALEQARNYYPDNLFLDTIFPELAESEDERIKKFLKDYAIEMIAGLESDISISVYNGVKGHDPDAEAELEKWRGARVWLEKQGEQKPSEWSGEDENAVNKLVAICAGAKIYRQFAGCRPEEITKLQNWLKSLRPLK